MWREQHQCNGDKLPQLKSLTNYHADEDQETFGFWLKVQAPPPNSMAWYIPWYPESEDSLGINTFLVERNEESEHFLVFFGRGA